MIILASIFIYPKICTVAIALANYLIKVPGRE